MNAIEKFKAALSASEIQVLHQCLKQAMQPLPEDAVPWYLGGSPAAAGYITPAHAKVLQSLSSQWTDLSLGLHWDTPERTPASRSRALAEFANASQEIDPSIGYLSFAELWHAQA